MKPWLVRSLVVLTALLCLGLVCYFEGPRLWVRWQCHGLPPEEMKSWETRFGILNKLAEHPQGLYGMNVDAFRQMIRADRSDEARRKHWVLHPDLSQRYLVLGSDMSEAGTFLAFFVDDRLVSFQLRYGSEQNDERAIAPRLDSQALVDDEILLNCISFYDDESRHRAAATWMPHLVGYASRCQSPRSCHLCCFVMNALTEQDLSPTPESWATWWSHHKNDPEFAQAGSKP